MRKLYQPIVPATIVLLALVMSAFWIMPVHADDGTPPSTAPAVTQPQGGSSTTDQSTTKATTELIPRSQWRRCASCESASAHAPKVKYSRRSLYNEILEMRQRRINPLRQSRQSRLRIKPYRPGR